jgi:hypothetical protein
VNIDIRDASAIRTLRPLEVAAYLRSTGWDAKEPTAKASTWMRTNGAEVFEVTVPLDETLRDYALRMGEVLHTLAAAENRSQGQVFSDLLTTFADVLRIRIDDPEAGDGTLSIEAHAQIAQKARDLLLAAACSAMEHRAVWHTNKPAQAIEQVRKLRVGQSERGSYIVTVISRVSPALTVPSNGELFESDLPFERQVTQTLATSLAALDAAAATAALSGKFDSFEQSVTKGVSANLCDAVAGLWGDEVRQRTLEFTFTWSPARPLEMQVPSQVRFSADQIPVIREASRVMKERSPVSDFELEGAVVKLDRKPGAEFGKVTVLGLVDGRPKRVTFELGEPLYHLAVQAHDQERALRCSGSLQREGRGYQLQNPRDVIVEEE